MSHSFIDRSSNYFTQNYDNEETQKKIDPIAQLKEINNTTVREWGPFNNHPAQMFVKEVDLSTNEKVKGEEETIQGKGLQINNRPALENEADEMGVKAAQGKMADVAGKGSGVKRKSEDAGQNIYYTEGKYPFSDFYWQYLMAEGKGLLGGWSKVKGQANVYKGKNGKTYAKVSAVGFSPSGINGSVEFGGDVEVYSGGVAISKSNFKKYNGTTIGDPTWRSVGETTIELPNYGSDVYLRINIGYIYSEGVGAAVPTPAQGHTKLEIPHTVVDAITHG